MRPRRRCGVSAELFDLLEYALQFSELTNGAFTYASAGRLYDFCPRRHPDAQALQAVLPSIDYRHVVLDHAARTVACRSAGVSVDLGGIGPSPCWQRSASTMPWSPAGGDSPMLGDRRGTPWIAGIRDPRDRQQIATRLPLVASSVYKQSRLASRTPEENEMVFDRNRGAIYALYQRALRSAPTLQGKLVLRLTIAPSGEVTDFGIVSSELDDPELERRLVARVKLFRFEAKEVEAITTTKPNRLLPRLKLMIVVQYCVGGRREKRFRDGRFRRGAVT